jgi:hypothetical protein
MERSDGPREWRSHPSSKSKRRASMDKRRAPSRERGIPNYRPKYLAFRSVKAFHFSGRSSSAKIADTGHTGTQAPQSMHSTGSMYNISSSGNAGASFLGWIQSTGQASTQAVSLVPMHGSAITYVIRSVSPEMVAELNRTANSNKNAASGTAFSRVFYASTSSRSALGSYSTM